MNPAEIVNVCSCGKAYTLAEWLALPYVGVQCDEVEHLEMRNCTCGSTRARVVFRNAELPTEVP